MCGRREAALVPQSALCSFFGDNFSNCHQRFFRSILIYPYNLVLVESVPGLGSNGDAEELTHRLVLQISYAFQEQVYLKILTKIKILILATGLCIFFLIPSKKDFG